MGKARPGSEVLEPHIMKNVVFFKFFTVILCGLSRHHLLPLWHQHLLLWWQCLLCYTDSTQCHLMLLVLSQIKPLHHTLSSYAQEAEMYFTSNTTMSFLLDNHALDVSIIVANVSRLMMCGEFSSDSIATIGRDGSAGFSFTNALGINIYSLAFTSRNRSWSCDSCPDGNSALHLQSTQ